MKYFLYGAGGHAKVIIDIIHANQGQVSGIVDDNFKGSHWYGIPVIGDWTNVPTIFSEHPEAHWIISIGDNAIRKIVAERMNTLSMIWGRAIHPSAIISPSVHIGEGTVCMPGVVINSDTTIGKHVILNTASTVDHDNQIGNYVHLSPGVHTAGNVNINQLTHIGTGASIIPGIRIGEKVIVGASACVVKDVEDHTLVVGCPARVVNN